MPRFLCLTFPSWPLQWRCREWPELSGQPIVLVRELPRGPQVVVCSSAAHRLGIAPGTPLPEAQSLAVHARPTESVGASSRTPTRSDLPPKAGEAKLPRPTAARKGGGPLIVLPHEPARDRARLLQLANEAQQFSPLVALESTFAGHDEPAALMLDLTGLGPLWKSEARLARAVLAHFTQQGWHARVAVASSIGLAWAAAWWGPALDTPLENPVLLPDCPTCLIDELPLAALRIDPATIDLLRQLGIDRVGQLLELPRAALVPRFGPQLLTRLDELLGQKHEALIACTTAPPLEARHDFESATDHAESVLHVLSLLVTRVADEARRQRLGIVQLVAIVVCDDHPVPPLRLRLFKPTASAKELTELVALHAESLVLRSLVNSLRVRVIDTGPLEQRQGELFALDATLDTHELALLVNRLASRLGDGRVLRVQKRASTLPERAVGYAPATATKASGYIVDSASAAQLRGRPLWLRAQPLRISVEASPLDDRPLRLVIGGRAYEVASAVGPERIETGWWRGPHVRRDYYQLETTTGSAWWVYRDLRAGKWYAA